MPHATIVLEDSSGRRTVIGRVVGDTFYKTFTWGQTFRRLGYAFGIECELVNMLRAHNVSFIRLRERVTEEELVITVDDWVNNARKLLSPATKSVRWYLTRDEMRKLSFLPNKKATNGGTVAQHGVVSYDQCTGKTANCQAES